MNFKPDQFPQKQESFQKEDVDFIFEQNPDLVTIGTKEQYSRYIESIFPNSKIKDVVYHGTLSSENILMNGFSKDFLGSSSKSTTSKDGFFFGSNKENSENYLFKDEVEWLAKVIYSFEKFKQEKGGEKELIGKKAHNLQKEIYKKINYITNIKQKELQKTSIVKFFDRLMNKNISSLLTTEEKELQELKKQLRDYQISLDILSGYEHGIQNILNKRDSAYLKLMSSKVKQEDVYDKPSAQKAFEIVTKQNTKYSPAVLRVKLNSLNPSEYTHDPKKNPFNTEGKIDRLIAIDELGGQFAKRLVDSIESGHDSHIEYNTFDPHTTDVFIVYNSDQIHTFGSKADLEKFKEFVTNQKTKPDPHASV